MELLRTEEDFYDLAWEYFKRFAGMGGVYCEVFFDAQGHTRRGIGMDLVMRGFERAQARAERDLGVNYKNPILDSLANGKLGKIPMDNVHSP